MTEVNQDTLEAAEHWMGNVTAALDATKTLTQGKGKEAFKEFEAVKPKVHEVMDEVKAAINEVEVANGEFEVATGKVEMAASNDEIEAAERKLELAFCELKRVHGKVKKVKGEVEAVDRQFEVVKDEVAVLQSIVEVLPKGLRVVQDEAGNLNLQPVLHGGVGTNADAMERERNRGISSCSFDSELRVWISLRFRLNALEHALGLCMAELGDLETPVLSANKQLDELCGSYRQGA